MIQSAIYFISTMTLPGINFNQNGVGVWPIIDLNSKIPPAMYRKNEVESMIRTNNITNKIWTKYQTITRVEGLIIDRGMSSEKIETKLREV
ncbi:LOW QUALITY PROTEIN: myb-like protein X [Vespula squamosa]|uniref:Myb-like protein X n=1 Tax=Vespula squamosa TaxID=30214 RepID=A0ABD2BHA3_VESSQ